MKKAQVGRTAAAVLLLAGLAATALGYPLDYGPFQPGHEPAAMTLAACELVQNIKAEGGSASRTGQRKAETEDVQNSDGAVREYRLPAIKPGRKPITLAMCGAPNGWVINLRDAQGQRLLPVPITNSMTSSQVEVFACDLNGDGQPDFIVNVWSGGCGLAAEGSEVTFLLSGKDGYHATSFFLYDFGKQDLVRFKAGGPVYFIFNDLIGSGGEKTRDWREHNFWVYDLYRIEGGRFVPADADQLGFPKWVWFTNKDNHEETTQLSQAQKTRLLMKRISAR